jgi:hypothetical protein
MTAHDLLAEAAAHGIELYRVGVRVRWRAAAPPAADLLARLREHRDELRPLVPERDPAPAPAADYQRIYDTLTATFGNAEDLRAFAAAYDAGARDLPERLAALEANCERLAHDQAPEADFRAAVEALVNFVRHIREAHQAAQQAEPVSNRPVLVGIADPCLICGGTTYHLPAVSGWVHCATCYPIPPMAAVPRARR